MSVREAAKGKEVSEMAIYGTAYTVCYIVGLYGEGTINFPCLLVLHRIKIANFRI